MLINRVYVEFISSTCNSQTIQLIEKKDRINVITAYTAGIV